MDLGLFRRGRVTFWAWIVIPALTVGVVCSALNVYCTSAEDHLKRHAAVLKILKPIEERMNVAGDVVRGFTMLGGGPSSAAGDVSTQISALARRHNFMINSLRVKSDKELKDDSDGALVFAIQGEGDLLYFMQFLNELQSPQHLTLIDAATLQLQPHSVGEDAAYKAELTVRCCMDALEGGDDA